MLTRTACRGRPKTSRGDGTPHAVGKRTLTIDAHARARRAAHGKGVSIVVDPSIANEKGLQD
jgi:hypothetical protein